MTNNESLVCDQEHALLIQETGLMEGVEADGYWIREKEFGGLKINAPKFRRVIPVNTAKETLNQIRHYHREDNITALIYATYRLDKILAKLPEWCFEMDRINIFVKVQAIFTKDRPMPYWEEMGAKINILMREFKTNRGQAAANAAAKLLHLLFKEGLVK